MLNRMWIVNVLQLGKSSWSIFMLNGWNLSAYEIYFNTSHVVVYLNIFIDIYFEFLFQYISCCSLSYSRTSSAFVRFRFQYISCCSLSHCQACCRISISNFNTSHVVVYHKQPCTTGENKNIFQYISCCSLSLSVCLCLHFLHHFNTSHVVVYRESQMKKFELTRFQYISCCSLSPWGRSVKRLNYISIHLML